MKILLLVTTVVSLHCIAQHAHLMDNTKYEVNDAETSYIEKNKKNDPIHVDKKTKIEISYGYNKLPESIISKDTVLIKGISTGEYVNVAITGKIYDFELVTLKWNDAKNTIEEDYTIKKIDSISYKTIIIETYIPEGIPIEKIKWKSAYGEVFEHIISYNGINDNPIYNFEF